MTNIPGVDYSSGHPGGAALKAARIAFACRYLSHTASKNITLAEAADLAAHGVASVVVWETTANRAGDGRNAGIADAKEAAAQAKACGMPDSRPVYFAVDWDANPTVVVAYFQGVASVLGLARTGVYGGYRIVKYLLDHGLARWAWQTVAWSQGRWDPRAHIRQVATTVRINSVTCDLDTALTTDYGQWTPGITPTLEDDMPLTDADAAKIAKAVAGLGLVSPTSGKTHSLATFIRYGDAHYAATMAELGALRGVVTALADAVKAGGGLTAEQATAAAEAGARAALAELGDALTPDSP